MECNPKKMGLVLMMFLVCMSGSTLFPLSCLYFSSEWEVYSYHFLVRFDHISRDKKRTKSQMILFEESSSKVSGEETNGIL